MDLSTVDLLLGKVFRILENEVSLLSGVRDDITEIERELQSMRSVLEDGNKTRVPSQAENVWVARVRDMACEIEDVIHEFMYHMSKQQQWRGNKCSSFFLKGIHCPQNLFWRCKTANKLQNIKKKLANIDDRKRRYGDNRSEGKGAGKTEGMPGNYDPDQRKIDSEYSLFVKDDELVGIEKTQKELLGWLTDRELQRIVISVVGMGGSGKTTLVANTFNKEIVKQRFECCAWVTVSEQYAVEELLRSMIKEINKKKDEIDFENLEKKSFMDLGKMLQDDLQKRRYLIVLDDVWSINLWQEISRVLPDERNGSRVMITTRNRDVASFQFGIISHVLELKPLRENEALKLFCRKAFPKYHGRCPPDFDSLARNLAEKCEGLPLAIVALGGLLSCKTSIDEWSIVRDNLNWGLSNNPELGKMKCILLLGFHQLPTRLKHCFLYCCIFPEDYRIKRNRLIKLWMAEGFVVPGQRVTPEVVAEEYLLELIRRGLLQVVKRNEFGRPAEFKMHDILRELAISISETEKFVTISDGKEETQEDNGIRRLSIVTKDKEMKAGGKGVALLRSVFVFAVGEMSRSSFDKLPSGLKLLTVLDLEGAPINEVPDEVVTFYNLRYLNLARTQVKKLPKSIGKLCNLQFLVLKETRIEEIPSGIIKLKNLRYLTCYHHCGRLTDFEYFATMHVPTSICSMKSLQILNIAKGGDIFVKELRRMTQLKKLSIANVKEANEKDLCRSIGNLRLLRQLMVMSSNEEERLKMDALISAPPDLKKLHLFGKLEKVPHWFNSLQNLTCLVLAWSRLREDCLAHIQALPELGRLTLLNTYEGELLCFREGFQKLKKLRIYNFAELKKIEINKGVMPGLQHLEIAGCKKFVELPLGLESLPDLKEVLLWNVSIEITEEICRDAARGEQPVMVLRREECDEHKLKWYIYS